MENFQTEMNKASFGASGKKKPTNILKDQNDENIQSTTFSDKFNKSYLIIEANTMTSGNTEGKDM